MREWIKVRTNKALFVLAVFSFAVITAEGVLYYAQYPDAFFRFLLILQNTIKAFTFKANISLENAQAFMLENPAPFKTALSYLYMICVFTAPYCTIATVYKVLERVFHLSFFLRKQPEASRIVVFGYNDTAKKFLKSADGKKWRIHVVCSAEPSPEERYRLIRKKIRLHFFDLTKAQGNEPDKLLKDLEISDAKYILLLDDSPVRNFSILQKLGTAGAGLLVPGVKVFCRCEDEGIRRLIESYYDTKSAGKKHRPFDLEIIDIPQMQIRSMFKDVSLHTYWESLPEKEPVPPKDWRVHLLILGFGGVGQQVLLQALNLCAVHADNPVYIDVVDRNVEERRDLFLNRFGVGAFVPVPDGESDYRFNPDWADGSCALRFRKLDVRGGKFREELKDLTKGDAGGFTYAVCAIDHPDTAIQCTLDLCRYLRIREWAQGRRVPVILRMDSDQLLSAYLKDGSAGSLLDGVIPMNTPEAILTLENLFDETRDAAAKQCNQYYDGMYTALADKTVISAKLADEETVEKSWNDLTLFRKNANRASAMHNELMKAVVTASLGSGAGAVLDAALGPEGSLIRLREGAWQFDLSDEQFIAAVDPPRDAGTRFAREMLMAEHRRWCYETACESWTPPEKNEKGAVKNDMFRTNPCLVSWEKLKELQPATVKYDLMPLMAYYVGSGPEKE